MNLREVSQSSFKSDWYSKRLQLPNHEPTDAAGTLEFCYVKKKKSPSVKNKTELHSIKKTARYARLSNETPVEVLHELLTQQWGLHVPGIIISVIGENDDIKIRTPLRRKFQKTLAKAAENTGAWIVTGGIHAGVTKTVGNAISKYYTSSNHKLVVLGIATWRAVANRRTLQNKRSGYKPVQYITNGRNNLNTDHTHFILVDDGSTEKLGREIELRSKIETYISERNENAHLICVVVQGVKSSSLTSVHNALLCGTPVVVVGDSGGWANVLAVLCKEKFDCSSEDVVLSVMRDNGINISDQVEKSRLIEMAKDCVRMKHLITVFSLNQPDGNLDLDKAILQAIVNKCANKDHHTENHLKLALAWNRADVAQKDILTAGITITDHTITGIFIDALLKNKPEFVQLLLDYWVNFRNSFTEDHLIKLYVDAGMKIKEGDPPHNRNEIRKMKNFHMGPRCDFKIENIENCITQDILRECFIWCIISKKKECARVMFNGLRDLLPATIVACNMLKSISKDDDSKDVKEDCLAHAADYKNICYGILSECLNQNSCNTLLFLKRQMERWGGQAFIEVAVDANEMDIISHPAVQLFLDNIWYGCLKKHQNAIQLLLLTAFIYIGAFLPFLIPLIIRLEKNKVNEISDSCSEEGTSHSESTPEQNDEADVNVKNRNLMGILQCFYGTPVVKFHLTVLFQLMFLVLYAYILLFNFFDTISNYEYALIAWVITLMLEEMRQLWCSQIKSFLARCGCYVAQGGNQLDLLGFALFIIGLSLRIAHNEGNSTFLQVAHVLYCLAFIVCSLRILSMFTVSEHLGPNLLMLKRMLKDLFFFIFIFVVFLTGYGVASHSLLYPNESDVSIFATIFIKPYWNIFGELFLNEISYNPTTNEFSCTNDTNLIAEGHRRCPTQSTVVPIMAAVYLLLANVLLLNLLIAMFSYTFNKLADKTDKIWKYQRYSLIKEYYMRPSLVAPFSFIPYFLSFLNFILQRCRIICQINLKKAKANSAFEQQFTDKESRQLMAWVQTNAENYLEDQKQKAEESTFYRNSVTTRLDIISKALNTVQENVNTKRNASAKIEPPETTLKTCNQSLQWIIMALIDNQIFPKNLTESIHTKARSSIYPESNVERLPLQDHMVPWNIPLSYHPPSYTDPKILKQPLPAYADKEDGYADLPYNEFDEELHVDRRSSHVEKYNVVDGLPRNPMGRTGLAGRGLLGRFGPNHAADPIVTRWLKNEHGNKVEEGGKPVLEFVAIKRRDTGDWAIPGGMVDPGENVTLTLKREFNEEVDASGGASGDEAQEQKNKIEEFLSSKAIEIYHGYCDDYRNTDNAWIETIACNFHDEDGSVFESIKLSAGDGVVKAKWKKIDDSLKLFADHKKYLEKVANLHKAHFRNE